MVNKRYLELVVSSIMLAAILVITPVNVYSSSTLRLDKTVFAVGEDIPVHFTVGDPVAGNAWIGIIPSHIPHGSETENDKNDSTYQYLNGALNGTLIFKAPGQIGDYDFRMNDTDNNGKEIASVSFHVGGSIGTLSLDRSSFMINEEIAVHFTAGPGFADNAWIGIIPSNVPHGSETENDRHDMTYQYLKNVQSGTLTFRAPSEPGTYDFRMHDTDNDGKEVASVTFQVNR